MYVDVCVFSLLVNSPVCMQMQIQSYWLDFWGSNGVTQHQWKKTICHKRANLQILNLFRKFANIQRISENCLCSEQVNISLSSFIYDNLCPQIAGFSSQVMQPAKGKWFGMKSFDLCLRTIFLGFIQIKVTNERHCMTKFCEWNLNMSTKTMLIYWTMD